MAAPEFNIVFKDREGNFHNCGAAFRHSFGDGSYVLNVSLKKETGEGQYGPTMRLDEAAKKALSGEGFLNVYPIKRKTEGDDEY